MKNILYVAIATSLAFSPTSIVAQPSDREDIVVSSIDRFIDEVARDLDRNLNRSPRVLHAPQGVGLVQVQFECDQNGQPANVTFYRKSDDPRANRLAREAVSKIKSLHPLPAGVEKNQVFMANIILADTNLQFAELSDQLKRSEAERIAASAGKPKVFAINLVRSPSS